MSRFTSTKRINTRWRNNDFIGEPGSSHTFADALHEEFLVDWAYQIQIGDIVITETPTTGNIQMSTLTVGNIVVTGTATGNFGAQGTVVQGTAPISISTSSNTSIVSVDQTAITAAAATSALNTRTLVRNSTASTIAKGSVVYLASSNGTVPTIEKALATTDATSARTFGIVQADITANSTGYVINQGIIDPIDTSGLADGSVLWLSATIAGAYSTTKPTGPNHGVLVGIVVKGGSVGNGSIYIFIKNGAELDEIHDVSAGSPSNGDIIQYKTSSALWTNQSISQAGIAASVHTHAYQPAGTYVTAVNGTSPITASTDTAGIVTVSLSASYASSTHTHATSSITSGNFVATLGAGTGVTVTGADANAAAKTVSIGQAVATSDAVTFASVNKLAITAPATSATLAIANAKTLTVSNTMTLTGVDSSSANIGNGGSLAPAGSVTAWLGSVDNIPTGWLFCDGTAVSRTTYATLFGVIGTNFGTGDGSTTFNLPNLTGNLLVGAAITAPGTTMQAGTNDAYLNTSWTHNHSHSHVTNPAATASGGPSTQLVSITQTGSGSAGSNTHTHTTDIAATTSDTDATNSPTITVKRTRVNYIIKW